MPPPLDDLRPRNARVVDVWSFVHLGAVAGLALLVGPLYALALSILWEPVEVLLLSRLLARVGVDFGHEGLPNTLSDLGFNAAGALLAAAWMAWTGAAPLLP